MRQYDNVVGPKERERKKLMKKEKKRKSIKEREKKKTVREYFIL